MAGERMQHRRINGSQLKEIAGALRHDEPELLPHGLSWLHPEIVGQITARDMDNNMVRNFLLSGSREMRLPQFYSMLDAIKENPSKMTIDSLSRAAFQIPRGIFLPYTEEHRLQMEIKNGLELSERANLIKRPDKRSRYSITTKGEDFVDWVLANTLSLGHEWFHTRMKKPEYKARTDIMLPSEIPKIIQPSKVTDVSARYGETTALRIEYEAADRLWFSIDISKLADVLRLSDTKELAQTLKTESDTDVFSSIRRYSFRGGIKLDFSIRPITYIWQFASDKDEFTNGIAREIRDNSVVGPAWHKVDFGSVVPRKPVLWARLIIPEDMKIDGSRYRIAADMADAFRDGLIRPNARLWSR